MKTFEQWLVSARRGERFEYHRGDLVYDTQPDYVGQKSASKAAKARYEAWTYGYSTGRCTLVQQRIEPNVFSYLAVRL